MNFDNRAQVGERKISWVLPCNSTANIHILDPSNNNNFVFNNKNDFNVSWSFYTNVVQSCERIISFAQSYGHCATVTTILSNHNNTFNVTNNKKSIIIRDKVKVAVQTNISKKNTSFPRKTANIVISVKKHNIKNGKKTTAIIIKNESQNILFSQKNMPELKSKANIIQYIKTYNINVSKVTAIITKNNILRSTNGTYFNAVSTIIRNEAAITKDKENKYEDINLLVQKGVFFEYHAPSVISRSDDIPKELKYSKKKIYGSLNMSGNYEMNVLYANGKTQKIIISIPYYRRIK